MYHFDADAAEHLHHKDNAKLQSQVRAGPAWTRSGAAAERRMRPPENANGAAQKLKLCFFWIYWVGEAWTVFQCQGIL